MHTRTLARAAAGGAILALTGAGGLMLAAPASAWTPQISATCTTVTMVNHEGEIAHVRGDIFADIPAHGTSTKPATKDVMVVSWYWDNDDAPPRGLTVKRPHGCQTTTVPSTAPPTTLPPTTVPPTTVPATTIPATTVPPTTVPATTVPPCEEDEPCWDCETMGNGQCGTTTTTTPLVTIPLNCRFPTTPDEIDYCPAPPVTTVPAPPVTYNVKTCEGYAQPVPESVVCPTRPTPAPTAAASPVQTANTPVSVTPESLPVTGAPSIPLLLGAVGLVASGGALLVITRRRAVSP